MSQVTEVWVGEKPQKKFDPKWWDKKDPHEDLFRQVESIETTQKYRNINNIKFARLYQNMEIMGFYGSMYNKTISNLPTNRLTLNVIASCIDTAAAKISKAKPKPFFLTNGGDFFQKKKAEDYNDFLEGLYYQMGIYQEAQKCFVDAGAMGTGALKFIEKDDCLAVERTLIDEIIVDDMEGMYGNPTCLYQRKYMTKDSLIDSFPDYEDKIKSAESGITNSSNSESLVKVVEGWKLGKRHAICISNATLMEEDWEDFFPFAFFRWKQKIAGFYGSGIAEELLGIQIEINKTLRGIQSSIDLNAVPRWLIENSSNVNTAHIQNKIASFIKYSGVAPQAFVAQAMSPEVYNYLENLYQKAFEIIGISQLSAMARKPAGLDAGVAIREYSDIESERFVLQGQRWEEFLALDAAKISLKMSKRMAEKDTYLKVKVKKKGYFKEIDWKDLKFKEDDFIMQCWPVSLLPSTPAGKKQTVTELVQDGYIDMDQAKSLLDFPDTKQYMSVANSKVENLNMILSKIVEDGEYTSPEPYMDLEYCVKYTQGYYLHAKTDGVNEEKLELLRLFIDDCLELQAMAMAQEQPPMPPIEAAPQDIPMDPAMMQGEVPMAPEIV